MAPSPPPIDEGPRALGSAAGTGTGIVPPPARWLGCAGLLPFLAGAAAGLVAAEPLQSWAVFALQAYGACILSFLGGIHWGFCLAGLGGGPGDRTGATRLELAVLPALVAWAGLLLGGAAGLVVLALGFLVLLLGESQAQGAGMVPSWYMRLRTPLTLAVLACLIIGLLGT